MPSRSKLAPIVRVMARCVPDTGGCLIWTGAKTPTGYGQINVGPRRFSVHRIAYEAARGPIPEGLEIDHLCRRRACVNPGHLEAVTHAENIRRALAAHTHCRQGHEMTPRNTKSGHRGGYATRRCRSCFNEARRIKRNQRRLEANA